MKEPRYILFSHIKTSFLLGSVGEGQREMLPQDIPEILAAKLKFK
jgi:hypothetical protein